MKRMDSAGALTKLINGARPSCTSRARIEQQLDQRWHKNYSLLQLMNIVGVALVLKVLHRKRYFAEHLVFAAHFLAFSYIAGARRRLAHLRHRGIPARDCCRRSSSAVTIGILPRLSLHRAAALLLRRSGATAIKTVLLWGGRWAVNVLLMGGSLFTAMLMVH